MSSSAGSSALGSTSGNWDEIRKEIERQVSALVTAGQTPILVQLGQQQYSTEYLALWP